MLQYSVTKCVFSRRLNLSQSRSGSLKVSDRGFQSDGPDTEKARGPSVLSRHRGTTKRRRVADRRCCHAETWDTGEQCTLIQFSAVWECVSKGKVKKLTIRVSTVTRKTLSALDKSYGKEGRKRRVFRRLRKRGRDDADVTWRSRSFQATGKAQSTAVYDGPAVMWWAPIVGGFLSRDPRFTL